MILATGATGNNGREIIKGLAAKGVAARAMVRDASACVLPVSVELVEADFDDAASLERALEGVDRAFLVTPSWERAEEQQLRFVGRARAAGVRHIVYLSQLHAAENSRVRFLRYHAAIETALADADIAFTNLRPDSYMLLFKQLVATQSRIMAPPSEAALSAVDVRDVAELAVAALTEPNHEGKSYDITGHEALTHAEMVRRLSAVLARWPSGKPTA